MPSAAELRAQQTVGGVIRPEWSAASLRAPMRGETLAIPLAAGVVKVFNVPDGTNNQPLWKGRIVNLLADGGDVFLQVSTGLDANVDETVNAVETVGAGGRFTLTPHASGNGCWKIPNGQWIPVPFGTDAASFALKSASACKVRTHIAES